MSPTRLHSPNRLQANGMFCVCGMNSMGILLSGGIGNQVSNWIQNGYTSLDMFSFDISRYHKNERTGNNVNDRTIESYGKTYAIAFKRDQPMMGRELRKSPLYDKLLSKGCFYQYNHGYERPGWFSRHKCIYDTLLFDQQFYDPLKGNLK